MRCLKVSKALHWLKLNHIDYFDSEISDRNLASYTEEGPPVVVDYHPSNSNKNPGSTSVHDIEEEDGTTEGSCPFIVHGLKGEEFSAKTMKTIKAIALQHLAIGTIMVYNLSPTDNMHPINFYIADTQETFSPKLRPENERYRLIVENPVAGARFFHFMVEMFIKHVLGVNQDHLGLYGKTAAYYATVEQQERLTLHLHMLLWILNSLSPQEIRDQMMDTNSNFQKRIVEYLESVHVGEFMTGSMYEVKEKVNENIKAKEY